MQRLQQPFSTRHGGIITFCKTVALALYGVLIFVFDLKYYLLQAPFSNSEFLMNLSGISLFILLLVIVWITSFPSYKYCYAPDTTLKAYVSSHVRLSCALVVPWLLFSALMDGIVLLPGNMQQLLSESPLVSYGLFTGAFLTIGIFFPCLIVRLWGCKRLPPGQERMLIEGFCRQANFKYAEIYLWNLFGGKLITAGVLGFVPVFRYLLISPTLLEMLDDQEIESVVAHEIGHVKHRHMLFYLAFILGYGFLSFVFYNIFYTSLLTTDAFLDLVVLKDGTFGTMFYFVPIALVVLMLLLYFRMLFGYVSRNFERQADLAAFKMTGSGAGIVRSLNKIAFASSQSRTAPSWHHFSIAQRADFMGRCERDPDLARRHDSKVRAIVTGYMVVVLGVAVLWWLNVQAIHEFEVNHNMIFIEKMVARVPHDPGLRFELAGMYYEKKLFRQAEKEYLITIALQPDFYEAYNNLAWLYATCENAAVLKFPEALRLARTAADIAPLPHILDTLAECFYVNGMYRKAVETSQRALAAHPEGRSYFLKQLQKFKDASEKKRFREADTAQGQIAL